MLYSGIVPESHVTGVYFSVSKISHHPGANTTCRRKPPDCLANLHKTMLLHEACLDIIPVPLLLLHCC